ncbi:phage gp6-like head-tail connector protein [Heyndrickxia camelliae]|uniref:phage gp6-like head-tail connector protein n=1 Tax=Heyndrickxia camelliae TaxID=1707093 RepID=UPI0026CCBF24
MSITITDELLKEFKDRMHISHTSEDDNLKRLLSFSAIAIKSSCGEFDIYGEKDTDVRGKELVFERTRYVYNDALEYFEDNFLSQITSLGISLIPESDEDATI